MQLHGLHPLRRRHCCWYFSHFLLLILQFATKTNSAPRGNETDSLGLLAFKAAVSDPTGALRSWNDTLPLCRWRGVSCGRRHNDRVAALDLASMGLGGSIPPSIGNLSFLVAIQLSNNKLTGDIPSAVGRLHRLRLLDLSGNQLGGAIPADVAGLLNLTYLDLSGNFLDGPIPPLLGQVSGLVELNLSRNGVTGSIPSSFDGLSSIQWLDLSHNNLTGVIPPFFANLTALYGFTFKYNNLQGSLPEEIGQSRALQYVVVSVNNISGELPASLYNVSSIRMIELSYNSISGSLRPDIGVLLPNLYFLSMFGNQLTGRIPTSLPNASALQCINLSWNHLVGVVPPNLGELKGLLWMAVMFNMLQADTPSDWRFLTSLTNCSRLQKLTMWHNDLGGELPSLVANLSTELVLLQFGENRISGTIPSGISNLVRLREIDFRANNFSGIIPESIGALTDLGLLLMFGNRFSGTIPSSFGNLTKLTSLVLNNNELVGEVPPSLVNCRNLGYLNVGGNRLTGAIPVQIFAISALSLVLDMSNNFFDGEIPLEVGHLQNIAILDLSNNRLTGPIPATISQCQVLQRLYLEGNLLHGSISSSLFRGLKGLEELDLSRNNLSGPFPSFLQGLQYLHLLNVSFNHLTGEVPRTGVFANATAIYVDGNGGLCGGIVDLHLPSCPVDMSARKADKSLAFRVIVPIVCVALTVIVASTVLVSCHRRKALRRRLPSATLPLENLQWKVSYSELVNATNGFSSDNLLGLGSYGSVYRGVMTRDGAEHDVAVKVLNLLQRGASNSFVAECEALRHARHRNLLKILTICASVDSKGRDFKALVFDYMPNGSLERWLHPEFSEDAGGLNLLQTLNIAIDVAAALDYLQNDCERPTVHCDLKPSNVLLDDEMVAHVGDFGLASFLDGARGVQASSVALKGSIGYIAPEYGMVGQVWTLGDVYSYGILVLEMFTGKRPTDEMFKEGLTLARFVEEKMSEEPDVMSIIGPRLLGEVREGMAIDFTDGDQSGHGVEQCLASVIRIGLSCANELPMERPSMKDVANQMAKIRAHLLMYQRKHKLCFNIL